MKRLQYLLIAIGLVVSSSAMASMSTSKIRSEARFLTDKMAYEMSLTTSQYNDIYEINYDFINSVGNIMDYVVRGEEWAMDDYYEALDVRNDDLRWILSDGQYRRFMGADYFYRPIYVNGGRWSFRIYINYPNRRLFYFGTPHHYKTYCGAHYRPHFHHVSYYRGRYPQGGHYPVPHRVRDERTYHTYRRSDFGSVHFRPNTSTRPNYAPTRPSAPSRPGNSSRPNGSGRPNDSNRPGGSNRPNDFNRPDSNRPGNGRPSSRPGNNEGSVTRPETTQRPSNSGRPSGTDRPSRPSVEIRPSTENRPAVENRPNRNDRPSGNDRPNRENNTPNRGESGNRGGSSHSSSRRSESNFGSTDAGRRTSGSSVRTERSQVSGSSSERRSSSESTRSNSSSSRSSERGTSSRR